MDANDLKSYAAKLNKEEKATDSVMVTFRMSRALFNKMEKERGQVPRSFWLRAVVVDRTS